MSKLVRQLVLSENDSPTFLNSLLNLIIRNGNKIIETSTYSETLIICEIITSDAVGNIKVEFNTNDPLIYFDRVFNIGKDLLKINNVNYTKTNNLIVEENLFTKDNIKMAIAEYIEYIKDNFLVFPIKCKLFDCILRKRYDLNFNFILNTCFSINDDKFQNYLNSQTLNINNEGKFVISYSKTGETYEYKSPIAFDVLLREYKGIFEKIKSMNDKNSFTIHIGLHRLLISSPMEVLPILHRYNEFYLSDFNSGRGWNPQTLIRVAVLVYYGIEKYKDTYVDELVMLSYTYNQVNKLPTQEYSKQIFDGYDN